MDKFLPVKQELVLRPDSPYIHRKPVGSVPISVIDLLTDSDDTDDSDDSSSSEDETSHKDKRVRVSKKSKREGLVGDLPLGFLDPLPSTVITAAPVTVVPAPPATQVKQFWKAGDYNGSSGGDWAVSSGGMDHVRVHPKFLHSNATSHKWVFGAFAELLDNSLDEVCNGATFAKIDMVKNYKDGNRMLLVEDNGGGMNPEKMRHCMSLGYSAKSKIANTIGQYGNGFKTSTMRLGADVIVFSRCCGANGQRPTQSVGLLSYTFLRSTGKEDIVVPMLDYERVGPGWKGMIRTSTNDWKTNVDTIVQWSPFSSEDDLLRQFTQMKNHGTRIFIYNLWEDDEGQLELDFDTDPHDIQIKGVNRDEKKIQMAKQYPNSKHFLTYQHSLRSYASILYLRIPPGFRIILRGKDVEHHNVVNDMMMSQNITYRPNTAHDGVQKDSNMVAVVTVGFVKDAKFHIDVQGFNVYHKNRLIKPFWRIWNAAGSDGRGVIGVLEANFVEPAHDKQGFERTIVLSRLESKLLQMQKTYWTTRCHEIGYAPRNKKYQESSPENSPKTKPQSTTQNMRSSKRTIFPPSDKFESSSIEKRKRSESEKYAINSGKSYIKGTKTNSKSGRGPPSSEPSSPSDEDVSEDEVPPRTSRKFFPSNKSVRKNGTHLSRASQNLDNKETEQECASNGGTDRNSTCSQSKGDDGDGNHSPSNSTSHAFDQLKEENHQLRERLQREEEVKGDLLRDLQHEKEKSRSFQSRLDEATQKIEELNKDQESLIDIFSEERQRRDTEEETLRQKLKEASNTIQELLDKVKSLEKMKFAPSKLRP